MLLITLSQINKGGTFNESEALSLKLHDIMNYSKDTFSISKAINPDSFRKKCDSILIHKTFHQTTT